MQEIEQKFEQLTAAQKDIFQGYGLRQVKHFIEYALPQVEAILPQSAMVQGINAYGQIQAFDPVNEQSYVWEETMWYVSSTSGSLDQKQDFLQVWKIFDLAQYALIDLSHVHRDFLEQYQLAVH